MQYVNSNNTSWTFDCNVFNGTDDLVVVVYNTENRETQEFALTTYVYENNTISFTQAVSLNQGVRYEFRIETDSKRLVYAAVTVEGEASLFNNPTSEEVTFV